MKLTEENKKIIDSKSYIELIQDWRFAPIGDPWMEGETGKYWLTRMTELRKQGINHSEISKKIGWERND